MECLSLEKALTIIDKGRRKTKDGITMAIIDLDTKSPTFYHFQNMDSLLTELLRHLEYDFNHILNTADVLAIPQDIDYKTLFNHESYESYGSIEDFKIALQKLQPSDFTISLEKEWTVSNYCFYHCHQEFCFMTLEDAEKVTLALEKKAYENLQAVLSNNEILERFLENKKALFKRILEQL